MRLTHLAALLLVLGLAPSAAGAPAFPDDITPREWKPDKEMKEITDGVFEIHSPDELQHYVETVVEALEEHPEWLDLHRFYLALATRAGRVEQVHARYREMAAQDTTNPDMHYLLGLIEKGPASATHHRKALALDENHYHARCALGLGLATGQMSGREEGYEHLFRALRARPDHPYVYQALVMAYGKSAKDFAQALKVAELWRKVEPTSVQPVRHEMENLKRLGKEEQALARLEAFSKEHPESQAALRMLIGTYRRDGRHDDALQLQIKLAETAKENPYEAYRAAQAFAAKQDGDSTLEWLLKAANRGLDNPREVEGDRALEFIRKEAQYTKAVEKIEKTRAKKIPALKAKVLSELITRPAPPFTVETLGGEEVSLSSLKGKIVVLDFWSTWCKPCRQTLPLVQRLYESMEGRPVRILCMNVWERDAARAGVAPYWKQAGYPMDVGLGSSQDAKNYGVTGVPALYVIDQDGQIRYQHRGYTTFMDEEVAWVIDSLIGETDQGAKLGESNSTP
jgi:thiol-disulfide isomerase/thioredoxin/tetratricopeptide (TPR) repeat protein